MSTKEAMPKVASGWIAWMASTRSATMPRAVVRSSPNEPERSCSMSTSSGVTRLPAEAKVTVAWPMVQVPSGPKSICAPPVAPEASITSLSPTASSMTTV